MGGIASRGQLRWSLARRAAVTVPLVLLLGFASGRSVPAGADNAWYAALHKPAATPPDWLFPVAWSLLYAALGLAVALVLNARGAPGRGAAAGLFALALVPALAWQPVFFGAHRVGLALGLALAMLGLGTLAALACGRVRRAAAWLMVPYLAWVGFAAALTWRIGQLNPDAGRLAPGARSSQML